MSTPENERCSERVATPLLSPPARRIWAKRTGSLLILALCLLPALSFACLGQYARPARDDFRFIGTYADKPFWEAMQQGLTHDFSVGYSFLTVKILLEPLGLTVVQIFPALTLTILFSAIAALLFQVLDAFGMVANKKLAALALAGLLLCAVFGNPLAFRGLYYYEAAIKYSLPIVPVVLFMLLLLHVARQPCIRGKRLRFYALLGWLLCFVAVGFSETFDIVIVLALGLLLVLTLLAGREWRRCLLVLASGCSAAVVGLLLLLSAPGLQDRIIRRLARPNIADRSLEEILAQAMQSWLDYIGDPAALASIALMVAVGILVGLKLPSEKPNARPGRTPRLPLLLVLVSQLLLLPVAWHHQSDQPILFGRFSAAYTYVIAMNALLILGAALLLYLQRRAASEQRVVAKAVATAGLVGILLCFAPTQLRDLHWRAYLYLFLSTHNLLILLGWHVARWLRSGHAQHFTIGLGCLYFLILAGAVVVALTVSMFSRNDIDRTYTFLAHLFAWLGLGWGLALGWTFRSMVGSRKLLAAGALLVAVMLTSSIVIENMTMLPRWRQYAIEFDDRLATIIQSRANGQRDLVFAPYSFDLTRHLRIGPMHEDAYFMQRYDIDSITLAET